MRRRGREVPNILLSWSLIIVPGVYEARRNKNKEVDVLLELTYMLAVHPNHWDVHDHVKKRIYFKIIGYISQIHFKMIG